MKHVLIALTALASSSVPAVAAPGARPPEARIPFVSFRTIRTYRPVSDTEVYLQDRRRNWYLATLAGPCLFIRDTIRIGVDTRFGDTLDNSSSFLVRGQRCPILSLVRSGPPPPRRRDRR